MKDSLSVEQRVIGAIARSKRVDAAGIRAETTFEELGMDSLDAIELLFEIEEEFDLTVEDEAVQGKENVGQVIEALHQALAEKAVAGADPPAGGE
ncbi:MAG: phosphopantetheine-binding protein [Thermoanaerobaculia bacterium]